MVNPLLKGQRSLHLQVCEAFAPCMWEPYDHVNVDNTPMDDHKEQLQNMNLTHSL